MTIGILSLQGAFEEHKKVLNQLGVDCIELRNSNDLSKKYDGIVLPGGESTVQGKLLHQTGMYNTVRQQILSGMPVLATCAGMILLASKIENDHNTYFSTIPMTVKRNAYGRQLGSFHTISKVKIIGDDIPMTFIRAPYVSKVEDGVEVHATVNEKIVGVKYKNQLAFAFHPELDNDTRIHQEFIKLI